MNSEERKWVQQLERSCDLTADNDFDLYQEAIDALRESRDENVLRHMLLCLRDVNAGEIQYELLEACELFPDEPYVRVFVEVGRKLYQSSPEWFALAFQSLLNTDSCIPLLISQIKVLPTEQQQFYREFIKLLADQSAKYGSVLERLS